MENNFGEYVYKNKNGANQKPAHQDLIKPNHQYDLLKDEDWPPGALDVKVKTIIRNVGKKRTWKTTKTYFFANGEQEVLERTDQEWIK